MLVPWASLGVPAYLLDRDIGELDDLAPLFGLVVDQLAELSRRHRRRHCADLVEPRDQLRVGERGVHRLVEDRDDLARRALRGRDAVPDARLVTRNGFRNRRDVRRLWPALRCRDAEGL